MTQLNHPTTGEAIGLEFLNLVWGCQDTPGYACVGHRGGSGWEWHWTHFDQDYIEGVKEVGPEVWLHEGRDLYFCPNLFSEPSRAGEYVQESRWLYADLDEQDPHVLGVQPSVSWCTSPGRWQALWYLSRALSPRTHRRLNQKLTYFCNADIGGWGINKVLRVPGSTSMKYERPFYIEEPEWMEEDDYEPGTIWGKVRQVPTPIVVGGKLDVKATGDAKKLMRALPVALRVKLRANMPEGRRSTWVDHLGRALAEEGLSKGDAKTLMLTSPTVMAKYGARAPGEVDRDLNKVYGDQDVIQVPKSKPKANDHGSKSRMNGNGHGSTDLKFESLMKFMSREIHTPGWLIEGIWSQLAHGILAGEHKSYKSLLALELAISVATGTKFLNYFDVPQTGPVIYIQQENPEGFVKDRIDKIAASRGLRGGSTYVDGRWHIIMPKPIPLELMNNRGFDLTNTEHMQLLARRIQELGAKLVILDPLYLMMPGIDENSAVGMNPIFSNLLDIKQKLGCGILLIHHYKKQDRANPFSGDDDRISGTSAMGRWYESLLLVERGKEAGEVLLLPKHRMGVPQGGLSVKFEMGPLGDDRYEVIVTEPKAEAAELFDGLRQRITDEPGITIAQLAAEFGLRAEVMRRRVELMADVTITPQAGRKSPKLSIVG